MRQSILVASLCLIGSAALATPAEDALEARHGLMKMISMEMGTLAGMAKGEVDYDETAASAAAKNLMALAQYDAPKLFIEGTSSDDMEGSDALPAIWSDTEDFAARYASFATATDGIDQEVMGGQGNLGPVLQKLGSTCSECHKPYRADR
ncbi:cytochrome c [Paracoccus sp. JM45]|uniref:c-type cytochrome n=1 Tax=Paracoccus sp. JM45 TaxID=2283626 RepID=UPI000E6D4852|nr:cytochrome c [Paracoccus sp. JM45]RJE79462.1 cytochrome c [Paracoccus sp. JM45]